MRTLTLIPLFGLTSSVLAIGMTSDTQSTKSGHHKSDAVHFKPSRLAPKHKPSHAAAKRHVAWNPLDHGDYSHDSDDYDYDGDKMIKSCGRAHFFCTKTNLDCACQYLEDCDASGEYQGSIGDGLDNCISDTFEKREIAWKPFDHDKYSHDSDSYTYDGNNPFKDCGRAHTACTKGNVDCACEFLQDCNKHGEYQGPIKDGLKNCIADYLKDEPDGTTVVSERVIDRSQHNFSACLTTTES